MPGPTDGARVSVDSVSRIEAPQGRVVQPACRLRRVLRLDVLRVWRDGRAPMLQAVPKWREPGPRSP